MTRMDQMPDRRRFLAQGCMSLGAGLGAGLVAASLVPRHASAAAESASAWSDATQSRMRLIGGGASLDGANLRAGVEIRLSTNYKTYWRTPGDSGVPPQFSWSGSTNLGALEVSWPAPHRFRDGTGYAIGYTEEVIFPLLITPIDKNLPVALKLELEYAVCEKLCIPARGTATLDLTRERTRQIARIASFEARVPRRIELGQAHAGMRITAASIVKAGTAKSVRLAIATQDDIRIDDVLIEGPNMWLFGQPKIERSADGWIAQAMLLDRPPTSTGASGIVVTIMAGNRAIETVLPLDFDAA
jgi:DsbC/DsbD-like thiol-disulfide interchange protein